MILIHQISNSDLEYKDDIKECLNHNLANPIIRKIVIFSSCIDLEKKIGMDLRSKKLLLLKFDLSLFDMMNYGKKNSKSFVIYGSPFIKFNVDLANMLKFDVKKVLKDDYSYYIFDRNLKIKNERDIDDILVGEKVKIFLKTEKLGYYKNSDFQSISYSWRVSKNFQKKDTQKVDIPLEEMSKVDIPLEEMSKVDIVEESIVEIETPKFEKIKNIIKNEYYTRKLDVVIVSVNYNDFLLISLENNLKVFENITVVTSSSDFMCQMICEKFKVNCIVTDIMYEDGAVFNKGKAINEGIRSITEPDYILLLDADIVVMEEIDVDSLEDDVLYTSNRYMVPNFDLYQSYISGLVSKDDVFLLEGNNGLGFFQLFNYGMNAEYPEYSTDAADDDFIFRDSFDLKKGIEKVVIHLGKDSNWKGRKSKSFLEYEQFSNLFEKEFSVIPKTFKICTFYYNPQKDVRREENFLKFLAQFEGYQDNILIGMVDYDGDLDIPDYLKDNIFVIKGDKENPIWYKETLLNKMIDVIDTDYIIWIDNDIIYESIEWLADIDSVVKTKDFVQLYKTINYLGSAGEILESHKSILSSDRSDIDSLLGEGYTPGGSWIGKTSILKEKKFFEKMYVGGGDTIFLYGLFGIDDGHTLKLVKESNKYIWKEAVKWIESNKRYRLGYLDVSINHLYHGELRDRKYDGRYKKLSSFHSTEKNKVPFSIIITAFNTAEFIEECLDSICNQTYFIENSNYEILIGIDCCIETLEKIKKIKNKYKNIKVFYFSKNMGTYVTSNTLIGLAKHENLIRFDSDDIMNENFIESISEYEKEYKMIRFNCRNFNQKNCDGRVNLSYGCIFFKKELFNSVGGYKNWICSADKDFVQRCQSIEKVKNIDLVLFKRRIHSNSLTRHEDTNSESEIRKMYNKMISDRFEYVTPTTNPKFEIIKSKKIVFIYDVDGWAFHKMSVSLKKHLLQYEIDIKRYDEFIDSKDYDLIICFSPNVLPKYARDYSKIVCGISSYKSDINTKLSKFKFVFANDEYLFNILNNENKFYLPNGIECSEYQKIEKQIDFNNIKIGTIGSIQRKEHKGYFRIKKIAEKLRSEGYPVEENSLFVDPYSDDVLNNEKLLKYYHENIDILIISSESETGPNILLEAMSLGIPVVANKTGLCGKLIIDGKNGFLVDEFYDLDGYVEKIKILCDKKEIFRKISMSCSESIKKYDWSVMYKNYDNMIKFILELEETHRKLTKVNH